MRKILSIYLLFSSIIFSQNVYFSEPTSNHIDYIGTSGEGPIDYHMYAANGFYVQQWQAKLWKPDGSQTNWMNGKDGGWWVNKAGVYQIQGRAYMQSIFGGGYEWRLTNVVTFSVIDNYVPATPQNVAAQWSGDHPIISWTANTELDLDNYKVAKRVVGQTSWAVIATVSKNSNSWTDSNVEPAGKFDPSYTIEYKILANDINGHSSSYSSITSVTGTTNYLWKQNIDGKLNEITKFELFSNYPNPFNPTTQISYELPSNEFVSLSVYNSIGEEVKALVNQFQGIGHYTVEFDGTGLSSGLYFYKIQAGGFVSIKKMLLTK